MANCPFFRHHLHKDEYIYIDFGVRRVHRLPYIAMLDSSRLFYPAPAEGKTPCAFCGPAADMHLHLAGTSRTRNVCDISLSASGTYSPCLRQYDRRAPARESSRRNVLGLLLRRIATAIEALALFGRVTYNITLNAGLSEDRLFLCTMPEFLLFSC